VEEAREAARGRRKMEASSRGGSKGGREAEEGRRATGTGRCIRKREGVREREKTGEGWQGVRCEGRACRGRWREWWIEEGTREGEGE
jgi:hypothetical protein